MNLCADFEVCGVTKAALALTNKGKMQGRIIEQ
jgi:hypothetical protein